MKKRHQKTTRHCAHCGHRFLINPRVGHRHRHCDKPECRRVSRARARKRWLKKNGGRKYFDRLDNTDRVRTWRKHNPHYWRREVRVQMAKSKQFVLTKRLSAALRFVTLQDSIDTHLALKIGIISDLCGTTLQDTIAKELRRLMLRGHAILRGKKPKT
ncbi:MAG: hypothetical protein Q8M02_04805 [Candidatus Didemnitutus sp.]|nr:hypothetical protein [Candidatus Didemnitutus sp.]